MTLMMLAVFCIGCSAQRICGACHGGGRGSIGSSGSGFMLGGPCPVCYGLRYCGNCMGNGQSFQEVPLTPQELNNLDRQIIMYTDTAREQM